MPDNLAGGHSPPYIGLTPAFRLLLCKLRTLASRAAPDNLTGGHSPPYIRLAPAFRLMLWKLRTLVGRAVPDNVTGRHNPPYSADEFRQPQVELCRANCLIGGSHVDRRV